MYKNVHVWQFTYVVLGGYMIDWLVFNANISSISATKMKCWL